MKGRGPVSLWVGAGLLELHHCNQRYPVQDLRSVFLYDDHVFQSHPSPSGDVNARFHGCHHADLKICGVCGTQTGLFMDSQSHAVPKSVSKAAPKPFGRNMVSRNLVYGLRADAWSDRLSSHGLGIAYGLIHSPKGIIGFTQHNGTRYVRTVPVETAPPVKEDRFVLMDRSVRGNSVGKGGIRACSHNGGKGERFGSLFTQGPFQAPGQVFFSEAR